MDHNTVSPPENAGQSIFMQLILLLFGALNFLMSHIEADEFRKWTTWAIGVLTFFAFLIINWRKIKEEMIHLFRKRGRKKKDKK